MIPSDNSDALHIAIAAVQTDIDPFDIADAGTFADDYFERNPADLADLNRILETYAAMFSRHVRNVERNERLHLADVLRSYNQGADVPAVAVGRLGICAGAGVAFDDVCQYHGRPYAVFYSMPANVPANVLIFSK